MTTPDRKTTIAGLAVLGLLAVGGSYVLLFRAAPSPPVAGIEPAVPALVDPVVEPPEKPPRTRHAGRSGTEEPQVTPRPGKGPKPEPTDEELERKRGPTNQPRGIAR